MRVGTFVMHRSGKTGVETTFPLQWRPVREGDDAYVIAAGASKGTLFGLRLRKDQMLLAIKEIETLEDQIRADQHGPF